MTSPLHAHAVRFRHVPRDVLADRNVLCRRRAPLAFALAQEGQPWQLQLGPPARPADARVLTLDWGGATACVRMPRRNIDVLVSRSLRAGDIPGVPDEILLAALEFGLDGVFAGVQKATRKPLRLASVDAGEPSGAFEEFGWTASRGEIQLRGDLMLDAAATRYLAVAMQEVPLDRGEVTAWDALPVPVRLVVGHVDLSAGAIRGLGLRDVLLLDESWLDQGGALSVQVGQTLGFICQLKAQGLLVVEGMRQVMADPEEDISPGAAHAAGAPDGPLLDGIPARLTFDLGERTMTLAELRTLQPGYLFNLGRDPRSVVSIRANGLLVGEGELVDIEGRIGVSIVRLGAGAAGG